MYCRSTSFYFRILFYFNYPLIADGGVPRMHNAFQMCGLRFGRILFWIQANDSKCERKQHLAVDLMASVTKGMQNMNRRFCVRRIFFW